MEILGKYEKQVYAILRIVSGAMFSFHGAQKILGILSTFRPALGSQMWFGGMIELVCGLLILAGFLTRPSAFLASGTMAVAYFQFHWKFKLGSAIFPTINQGELAVLYCFVFLFIATKGAGIWGIDKK